ILGWITVSAGNPLTLSSHSLKQVSRTLKRKKRKMKISGINTSIPSRTEDNQSIKLMVTEESNGTLNGQLRAALSRIDFYLAYSQASKRQWLTADEAPFRLFLAAL